MNATVSREFLQLWMGSGHDGEYKDLRKNCPSCRFYAYLDNQERCYWGFAWKVLVSVEKPKKCQYYDKPSPREEWYKGFLKIREGSQSGLESCVEEAQTSSAIP